ncbi:lipoprotein [Mycoplasma mycoides subsp. capri]|uniref:lipoprotein n=1 Tax=Mycoplasma mycoides TaxID=2102 RepID=UPI00223FE58A|nr:lipoprotein [Mycoplasma mycoides]UZK64036.1 lipoprotein [Mycoplasma mycoides subsp. capri]
MKKLLTILGSITIITTTSTAVIACKNIKQLEFKNKETEQDKKESKESRDEKQKEKANESEKNLSNRENEMQGDQPKNNNYQSSRTRKETFGLIKKYGKEFFDLLLLVGEKAEKIDNDKNVYLLSIGAAISKSYKNLEKYHTLEEFEKQLKTTIGKTGKSSEEFISNLEKEWDRIIREYEKERENILSILKSLK